MMRTNLACILSLAMLAGSARAGSIAMPPLGGKAKANPAIAALRDHVATLRTNLGDIVLKLDADAAPNTVRHFIKLAQRGAYDGLRFPGVFKDRMIVAGDPAGAAEAAQTLPDEKSPLSHSEGAVAMDRTPGAAGSGRRFFISLTDQSHLDEDYTVFAEVSEGLAVARRIGAVATRDDQGCPTPLEDIVIEQVIVATLKKAAPAAPKSDTSDKE